MVATPEGRLSHYFYGIEYGPRDLRLALVEASDHKIGTAVDQVLLAVSTTTRRAASTAWR